MKTKTIICISVLIAIVLLLSLPKVAFTFGTDDINRLNEWYYYDETGERVDISLPFTFPRDKDGYFTMSTVLPETFSSPQVICFYTDHQAVYVTLGSKLVYAYDNSSGGAFGDASTPTWNHVIINDGDVAGQELTIKTYTPYNNFKLILTEIVFGKLDQIHIWLENSFGFYVFVDCTFAWIGVLFIVLSFFHRDNPRNRAYQQYAGIILILFAGYLRTGTKSLPIYWINGFTKEFICFICLFALAVPLILYVRTRVIRKVKMVRFCNFLVIVSISSSLILFTLHSLNVIDIHRFIFVGVFMLLAAVITGITFGVYYYVKYHNRFLPITLISLFLIIAIILLESLHFYQLDNLPFDASLLTRLIAVAVIAIESSIYVYYLRLEVKRRDKIGEENRNLRIQMFSDQIKPHFILNTVGAIRTLIKTDGDRASELLYEFSKYIRSNLEERDYTKPIPFLEELDYIETYLKLEKARFGDRINVEYDIGTDAFWVLPLTVQPFVENAIKHGLFPLPDGGTLKISTQQLFNRVRIIIEDNGVGFDMSDLHDIVETKKSIGMKSSIMRIEKEMSGKVVVESSRDQGTSGTKVSIEIPIRRGRNNENDNS